jgi:hypothetical protein
LITVNEKPSGILCFKKKGEVVLAYAAKAYEDVAVKLHSFLTSALHGVSDHVKTPAHLPHLPIEYVN